MSLVRLGLLSPKGTGYERALTWSDESSIHRLHGNLPRNIGAQFC